MVLKKEHPGYVFNSMNGHVMFMAAHLLVDELATVEGVDRAWMVDRSAPMGPFGMMDLFGLDLMRDSWSTPTKDAHRETTRERLNPSLPGWSKQATSVRSQARASTPTPTPLINDRTSPTQRRARRSPRTHCSARSSSQR